MTITTERTQDDTESTADLVLRREGAELVVPRENVLTRVATHPAVARTIDMSRTAARAAGKAGKVAARAATTSTPATRVRKAVIRFFSGQLVIGPPRTDATFWRAGSRPIKNVPGKTGEWSYRPGWSRLAIRLGVILLAAGVAYWVNPDVTRAILITLSAFALVVGSWGTWYWIRTYSHRKRYLRPLHEALRGALGQTATRPEEWLHIPVDFKRNPGQQEMRIDLPPGYAGDDGLNNHVRTVVRGKLDLDPDTNFHFHVAGDRPFVLIREPARVPRHVSYQDILPLLQAAKETAPIIGLTAGRKPVDVDLESDSPHVLVSAGSGGGKSVLMRAILAQALSKGGYAVIFDIKRVSHMWANNLPNVRYVRSVEAIHEQLIALKDEIDRRTLLVEQHADIDGNTDHVDVGPRLWVAFEEMNATINRLNAYWRLIKQPGQPNLSPAVDALLDVLFMGRQIKVHVVGVAQSGTARTMGGPEGRENFATRCLARYTVQAWRMLVPEVWPMPKKPKQPGRWQIVKNGEATETQAAYLTPKEARELAQLGLPKEERREFESPRVPVSQASHDRPDLGQEPGTVPEEPTSGPPPRAEESDDEVIDERRLVTLREAINQGVVNGMTLDNLRKLRQRDEYFPQPVTRSGNSDLYDAEQLAEWARKREAARSLGRAS